MKLNWPQRNIRWFAAGALVTWALAVPPAARAGIFDIFDVITSVITGPIGGALTTMNNIQKQATSLQQDVVAPLALINQARGYIGTIQGTYHNWMSIVHKLPINSAQLPSSKSLETMFLGGKTVSLGQMSGLYQTSFGALPSATAAPQAHREMIDMDDAIAKDALSLSVAADESATTILSLSSKMEDVSGTTAPGTADMISAASRAAELQSLAAQHRLFAAMLREEATYLAHDNGIKKQHVIETQRMSSNIGSAVSP